MTYDYYNSIYICLQIHVWVTSRPNRPPTSTCWKKFRDNVASRISFRHTPLGDGFRNDLRLMWTTVEKDFWSVGFIANIYLHPKITIFFFFSIYSNNEYIKSGTKSQLCNLLVDFIFYTQISVCLFVICIIDFFFFFTTVI